MSIQVRGWHRQGQGRTVCERLASLCVFCLGWQDKPLAHNRGPGGCLIVRGVTLSDSSFVTTTLAQAVQSR
jgi:hypothetical protein